MGQLKSREMAKQEITDEWGISIPLLLLERALVQGRLGVLLQFNASVGKLGMYPQLEQAVLAFSGKKQFMKDGDLTCWPFRSSSSAVMLHFEFAGW